MQVVGMNFGMVGTCGFGKMCIRLLLVAVLCKNYSAPDMETPHQG